MSIKNHPLKRTLTNVCTIESDKKYIKVLLALIGGYYTADELVTLTGVEKRPIQDVLTNLIKLGYVKHTPIKKRNQPHLYRRIISEENCIAIVKRLRNIAAEYENRDKRTYARPVEIKKQEETDTGEIKIYREPLIKALFGNGPAKPYW